MKLNLKFNKIVLSTIALSLIFSIFTSDKALAAKKKKANVPEIVEVEAKDGFYLIGELQLTPKASSKNKVPLVILLHSLGRSRSSWGDLPQKINKLGAATLNMDLRGHGESVVNGSGKNKYWVNFPRSEFKKYSTDILSVIDHVKENYPEINYKNIALLGGDIGANAAVMAGSEYNKDISTLVLLSPSLAYKNLNTQIPLVGYGKHPVLMVVSKLDKASYNSSIELIKYAQGYKKLKILNFGGIGVNLLKHNPKAKQEVLNWVEEHVVYRVPDSNQTDQADIKDLKNELHKTNLRTKH